MDIVDTYDLDIVKRRINEFIVSERASSSTGSLLHIG